MKRKICVAVLALCSGVIMVFAATADKCTEKHKGCVDACNSSNMMCKSRGNDAADCDNRFKQCTAACDTKLKECQAKKIIGK